MSSSSKGKVVESMSTEESNKLRASLGIKPLQEEASGSAEGTSRNPRQAGSDRPSESSKDAKKQIAAARNKREHEEFVSGEGVGDILAREEGRKGGAADWIARTRGEDGSMKTPSSAAGSDSRKRKSKDVSQAEAEVPKLKVRHDASQIMDGEQVVMTLSDKPILNAAGEVDDTPDELSNVRMSDMERARHHDALKNQKEYDPHKEGQDILEKYDELNTGPIGFMLGGASMVLSEEVDPEKKLAILTALSEKQSLETKTRLQKDYYTSEEMQQFRKPPKKKIKRRENKASKDKEDQIGGAMHSGAADFGRPGDAGSDEEDPELYEQLSKQRRLVRRSDAGAVKKGEAALAAVSERVQSIETKEVDEEDDELDAPMMGGKTSAEAIAMTATTEFCNVVQTPLEKMETLKHESFRGSTLYKQQAQQRKGVKVTGQKRGGGVSHQAEVAAAQGEDMIETLTEDSLDLSCASGLAYLRARAQIGNDQESHKNRKSDNRPLEMSTLDGDIKLEYRDDYGRVQTPKEAFRAISWKFHGKIPGRKNMERRLLRLENEMRLKSMDVISQLPTLRALRHVQRAEAKPFMVLSGANEK